MKLETFLRILWVLVGVIEFCLGLYYGIYVFVIGGIADLINEIKSDATTGYGLFSCVMKILLGIFIFGLFTIFSWIIAFFGSQIKVRRIQK